MLQLLLLALAPLLVFGEVELQKYAHKEKIPLYVDHVVPYHNPSESYSYYHLKFCQPSELKFKSQTLGEVLQGSRKIYSPYHFKFAVNEASATLCKMDLDKEAVEAFRYAILHKYYFSFYFDEIPVRGFIGEVGDDGAMYLYKHQKFTLHYNGDRVIEVSVSSSKQDSIRLDPTSPAEFKFTYSAEWSDTDVEFEDRAANNPNPLFAEELDIQWFSIINSLVLVMLLTGFIAFIVMRILKKDYQRYMALDEEDDEDETGWKLLHGDVFRLPQQKELFSALMGAGAQLLLIFFLMLTLAVIGVFYPYGRGTMYAAIITLYALTATVSGYISGSFYAAFGGGNTSHLVMYTVGLFPVPVFVIWSYLNSIAWAMGSTAALPFGTICALFAMYFLVTFPLALAGAGTGLQHPHPFEIPCKTNKQPRLIPKGPWYSSSAVHILVGGFLPFSAIFVELYYVFISLWGHQLFIPYEILYLCFIILLLVTACITVSLTYLQLSMENHQWWWLAYATGGSSGLFTYGYCFYFLFSESEMYGSMQISFYLGYMLIICYGMFIMLGAVGWYCSYLFVKRIFSSIKCD